MTRPAASVMGRSAHRALAPRLGGVHKRPLFLAAGILTAGTLLVLGDWHVATHQDRLLRERRDRQAQLDRQALFYVRMDIDDVTYSQDGRYQVRLWIENLMPEVQVYAMMPTVQGSVQVGSGWQEVESRDATREPGLQEGSVLRLDRRVRVDWLLDIPQTGYFQAFPGYVHVELRADTLVSFEPNPEEYVAERHDTLFMHLKPIGADDEYLRRVNRFPGKAPVFVPTVPRW